MEKRVFDYIENNHMISEGDTVVAGVSGGADSVCLLLILHKYAQNHQIRLIAAHVHHGLRENADGDEAYVKKICSEKNIPLEILHIDAKKEAMDAKISVEEAGRRKRYEFFERVGGEGCKIAVAHQRDDLCETMLFQLFRGSGVSGMRGILPVAGAVIRPLLTVSREEIEVYLKEQGISWRTDESNEDLSYSRNRIRHVILPAAEEICSEAKEHMAEASERLRELEIFLGEEADRMEAEYLKKSEENGKRTLLIRNEVMNLPAALKGELLLRALVWVSGKKRDLGLVQVEALQNLFSSQVGKKREFIYGIEADRSYDGIFLSLGSMEEVPEENIFFPASEKEYPFAFTLGEFAGTARVSDAFAGRTEFPDPYVQWLDYEKIKENLCFRHPKEADYITVNKDGGHKLLKDYLKDEKVPANKRDGIWVLAGDHHIWWVVGYRIGEDAKVTDWNKNVICIGLEIAEK